jgi:hypothetical protein
MTGHDLLWKVSEHIPVMVASTATVVERSKKPVSVRASAGSAIARVSRNAGYKEFWDDMAGQFTGSFAGAALKSLHSAFMFMLKI